MNAKQIKSRSALLCTGAWRALVRPCLLAVLSLPWAGCGGDAEQYKTVPVSGVVTCKGVPVANATVNFTPLAEAGRVEGRPGRLALGKTDKDGRFTLTTYENDDGAIVGKHTVTVGLNFDEGAGTSPGKGFPCRDSSKEVTVTGPTTDMRIEF